MSTPDRATFEQLADEWEQATRLISNIEPFLGHPPIVKSLL